MLIEEGSNMTILLSTKCLMCRFYSCYMKIETSHISYKIGGKNPRIISMEQYLDILYLIFYLFLIAIDS